MDTLELELLQSIKELDILTPQNVTLIDNETLPPKLVQYCVEIKDKQFHLIVERNRGEILILGKDGISQNSFKYGEQLYQELRQKARVWYKDVDFSKYTVRYIDNQGYKIKLDQFSFIQPFVLKSVDGCFGQIGLDFLTIFSLLNKE